MDILTFGGVLVGRELYMLFFDFLVPYKIFKKLKNLLLVVFFCPMWKKFLSMNLFF